MARAAMTWTERNHEGIAICDDFGEEMMLKLAEGAATGFVWPPRPGDCSTARWAPPTSAREVAEHSAAYEAEMAPIRAKFQAKQEAEKAERDRLETPSLLADDELRNQICALAALAGSRDRGEADRARAILLTLSGWTSPRIAEAFSVREDTVRLWRSDFSRGGTDALKASVAPGPSPVKSETALRVVTPLLEEPVANRPNWTIARMRAEIEAREGVRISRSQLSKALRKKSSVTGGRGTP